MHQCVEYGLFVNIPLSELGLRGIMIAFVGIIDDNDGVDNRHVVATFTIFEK